MADFWLVNGKTNLIRKALRRSRKSKKQGGLMAKHRKSGKHRNGSKKHRRSYHRNAPALSMGGATSALLWGGAGYLASKFAGNMIARYLPAAIPAQELVSAAAAGAAVSYAGKWATNSSEGRAALRTGALIPVVEAAVNMTALGSMLGTQKVLMLPAAASRPSGVQAALSAALAADLRDGDDIYSGY